MRERESEYSILRVLIWMSKEALSLYFQLFPSLNTPRARRRIRSRRKRTSIAAFARTKKRENWLRGSGSVVSLSLSLSLVVFCVLSRENKHHLTTEREISPNEKIMVEVIEILDSDEEGDERVRIVQQNFEPRLRPIREEEGNDTTNINNNNRDEDVVITGAR